MYPTPVPPRRKVWPWILGAAVVALLAMVALCAGLLSSASKAPAVWTTPSQTPAPPAVAKHDPNTIAEGEWLVGKEVAAGTYRTAGAADSAVPLCHWAVWTDDSKTEAVAIGVANKPQQPGRVVIKKGQVFETSGCKPWAKQD